MTRTLLLLPLLAGCAGGDLDRWLDDPWLELPGSLRALGAYEGGEPSEALVRYAPTYPLWTNGSDKDRFVALPEGTTIDVSDPDDWSFPDGAILFKTFSYGGTPVETRLLRRDPTGWDYAVYVWNDAGTAARSWDPTSRSYASVTVDGEALEHEIPNKLDCRTCHESDPNEVIGLDLRQLGAVVDGERQADALESLLSDELPAVDPVLDADADLQHVKRWVVGNCTHCHDGRQGDNNAFDLNPDVFVENTVNQETASEAAANGTRIVPGDAAGSLLFQAVSGETDDPEMKLMPPAGVQRRDAASLEVLRRWIDALEDEGA